MTRIEFTKAPDGRRYRSATVEINSDGHETRDEHPVPAWANHEEPGRRRGRNQEAATDVADDKE